MVQILHCGSFTREFHHACCCMTRIKMAQFFDRKILKSEQKIWTWKAVSNYFFLNLGLESSSPDFQSALWGILVENPPTYTDKCDALNPRPQLRFTLTGYQQLRIQQWASFPLVTANQPRLIATRPIGKDFWAPDSEPPPLGVGPNMVQFPHSLLGWKQFHNVEETILDIATVSLFVRL